MHIVFGASGGALISEMTASQAMFQIVGAILENCPGKSAVTSVLEHPSAYDAVKYYCDKTGKEFRVAQANPKTGGIDVEEIRRVVSPDTCLLSIMYASNITGSIMDMAGIVKAAREINPDIYIVTDAVQHAPHAVLDVDALASTARRLHPINSSAPAVWAMDTCPIAWPSCRTARSCSARPTSGSSARPRLATSRP